MVDRVNTLFFVVVIIHMIEYFRISGSCPQPGIFIVDILEDSITALDGRIRTYDRLLYVNGADVSNCKIKQASDLIKVRILCFNLKLTLLPFPKFKLMDCQMLFFSHSARLHDNL